jgi:O-acetyl-ADP-ribose deacetylase
VELALVQGDITAEQVDAIVNAANHSLMGGGGVDGAIHRRGGPAILAECRAVRTNKYPDGLPTGEAVATTAGRLSARWVIHAVGPVYAATIDHSDLLRACYVNSLRVADELGADSVAFPLISSGIYGWPVEDAARQALTAITTAQTKVSEVHLVLYSAASFETASRVLEEIGLADP